MLMGFILRDKLKKKGQKKFLLMCMSFYDHISTNMTNKN